MNASVTSTETTESASNSAALIEQISFQRIYDGLSQHGITLNQAEQTRLEEIVREEVRKQNGGQLAGMNLGGTGVNLIQILFSFIQQLFGGGNGAPEFSLAGITDSLSNAATGATNNGRQYVFDTISANIHDRLRAAQGNLAQAADLVTGLTTGPGNARDIGNGASIGAQLAAAADVPAGTTSRLNPPTDVADASGGNGLPPNVTRPLTPRALSS